VSMPEDYTPRRGAHLPVPYSEELCAEIVAAVASGIPLQQVLRSDPARYPAKETFRDWRKKYPGLNEAMEEARIEGAHEIALRLRATARGLGPSDGGDSAGDVQRDKLIIDTDLRLLAKWFPTCYGEKMTLSGDLEAPLHGMSDVDLDAAIAAKLQALEAGK
jgi:hypothetical protein